MHVQSELTQYLRAVAPYLFPFLQGRPLRLQYYPNGVGEECLVINDASQLPDGFAPIFLPSPSSPSPVPLVIQTQSQLDQLIQMGIVGFSVNTRTDSTVTQDRWLVWQLSDEGQDPVLFNQWVSDFYHWVVKKIGKPTVKTSMLGGVDVVLPLSSVFVVPDRLHTLEQRIADRFAKQQEGIRVATEPGAEDTNWHDEAGKPVGLIRPGGLKETRWIVPPFGVTHVATGEISLPLNPDTCFLPKIQPMISRRYVLKDVYPILQAGLSYWVTPDPMKSVPTNTPIPG